MSRRHDTSPWPLVWLILALAAWFAAAALLAGAEPDPRTARHAVVRVPSHGASATVIWTTQGRTWLLGCAHAFQGANARKPVTIDAPDPAPGSPRTGGVRLLALDHQRDLSLCELGAGPLPYCAPVARAGHRPRGDLLSVGYDEMRLPPQARPARSLSTQGGWTYTRERPWHGRSGGALLDPDTGELVGVVSGYTGPQTRQEVVPGGQGVYVSHGAILAFLRGAGWADEVPAGRVPPGMPGQDAPPLPRTPRVPAPRPGGT